MEIITMLKANIRHKKGSFVSIILLMMIITMAMTAILSVQDNIYDGIAEAHERENTGNVVTFMGVTQWTDSLQSELENHKMVREVTSKKVIPTKNVICGDVEEYSNTVFVQEIGKGQHLFDAKAAQSLGEAPELKAGEMYISQGMKTNFSCETGDKMTLSLQSGDYEFTIAGVVEDAMLGASVIGWKNAYIGEKDFARIYQKQEPFTKTEEKAYAQMVQVSVYKTQDCELSDDQFARRLNMDTGFVNMSSGSITRSMSTHYTYLFAQVIGSILIVFVLFLLIAVIVVICHSVSVGIEMEYASLGIMKAQGFTKGKLRGILLVQYLLGQMIGAGIGMIAAISLSRQLGKVFYPITGIVPLKRVAAGKCVVIILGMLVISAACICVITRKIAVISPVRALSGGKCDVHFDSRMQMPIKKKMLSAWIALRQFTSDKRRYIGVIAIGTILVFFMTTMMVLGNIMTAESAWKAMGIQYSNLDVTLKETVGKDTIQQIEKTIEEYSHIEDVYRMAGNFYYSVNGEQMMVCVFEDAKKILAVSDGRQPLYDNEIVMTKIAAESMGFSVGDRVTLEYKDKKAEYIICGLNQHMNDAGRNINMTIEASRRLGNPSIYYMGYTISDSSAGKKIVRALEKTYADVINKAEFSEVFMDESYEFAIYFMTVVVYLFSAIFIVVVTHIMCSKAFLRERTDIGIYKALGFTSGHLQRQFAVRFLIVAVLGSVVGSVLAALFSGDVLSLFLRMVGISEFVPVFHIHTFAIPMVMICGCFFLFSYMEARRVRRVEVRELVVE